MESLLDSPFVPPVIAGLLAGLLVGALARLLRAGIAADLAAAGAFLAAYVGTYEKIPDFPPVGSVNKIFYVALIGSLAGAAATWLARPWRLPLWGLASAAIALWIAAPRLGAWDAPLLVTLALLIGGGAVTLAALDMASAAEPMRAPAMLAALAACVAPVALFGASSTSVGLCVGLAAGLGAMALLALAAPRRFGPLAILGAGGGLLAVVDTVTLITRRADPFALLLLIAVSAVALRPRAENNLAAFGTALLALLPIVPIVALLLLRHDLPF